MSTTHTARIQQELAAITQPLVDHYNELDRDIDTMNKDLIELRKARTQLRGVLRGIDPALVPAYGSNGKPKKKHDTQYNNSQTLGALTKWAQDNRDKINADGGVYASGLIDQHGQFRDDFPADAIGIRNQSKLSAAMKMLHEQGVLRLDRKGNGGAKYYKVV